MPQIGEIKKVPYYTFASRTQRVERRSTKYVWAACVDCGKERWVLLKHGHPSNPRCPSCAKRLIHRSEQTRQKMGASHLGKHYKPMSPEGRKHISTAQQGKVLSETHRAKIALGNRGRVFLKESRRKISQALTKRWSDPIYRSKRIKAIYSNRMRKPNKAEIYLADILKRNFPQFEYNGDFRLGIAIGGSVPDFVNLNSRKEIIELFGDYYHSPKFPGIKWQDTELGKTMLYGSLGYKCLIIWEHELKDEQLVINKIDQWLASKRQCRRTLKP